MTAATDPPNEPVHLCCDDYPDPAKAPQNPPEAQNPVTAPKHTTTPAKVPANAPTRPIPEPVVNAAPDPLENFLLSLTSERKAEIQKYSNLPESELEIPTEKRAAAILAAFYKQHATIPAGQRNHTLFKLSCTLRRCGYEEKDILAGLWQFSRENCKPPHNQNSRDDVAELTSLASRAGSGS